MKPIYKPGLFSTPMVQSIDQDRKSQTRRIACNHNLDLSIQERLRLGRFDEISQITNGELKPKYDLGDIIYVRETCKVGAWKDEDHKVAFDYKASPELTKTPWIEFNDIERFEELHLKTIEELDKLGIQPHRFDEDQERFYYKWEPGQSPLRWKPSIFMPMEAARFFLEVTNVRAERLQDISEEDAIAEGIEEISKTTESKLPIYRNYLPDEILGFLSPEYSYQSLWDSLNAEKAPWKSNPWVWVYEFKKVEKPNNWPI